MIFLAKDSPSRSQACTCQETNTRNLGPKAQCCFFKGYSTVLCRVSTKAIKSMRWRLFPSRQHRQLISSVMKIQTWVPVWGQNRNQILKLNMPKLCQNLFHPKTSLQPPLPKTRLALAVLLRQTPWRWSWLKRCLQGCWDALCGWYLKQIGFESSRYCSFKKKIMLWSLLESIYMVSSSSSIKESLHLLFYSAGFADLWLMEKSSTPHGVQKYIFTDLFIPPLSGAGFIPSTVNSINN